MKIAEQALDLKTVRLLLGGITRERSLLAAMRVMYSKSRKFFRIPLPGFNPYVIGSPQMNRQVLVTERQKLLWRNPHDPVTSLLKRGVLVVDGPEHDRYREIMQPALAPARLPDYVPHILRQVDRVTDRWTDERPVDMLVESRRIALLVIMDALFSVDFWEDMPRLWKPIQKAIQYISPGMWIIFPKLPRPGFRKHLRTLDQYLYGIIRARRSAAPIPDLLGHLISAGLDDERIRDQVLTMLIAGHDTSTALLAWTFYLLGTHPAIYEQLNGELDAALHGNPPQTPGGWQPPLLDDVIREALRLYPPIHLGSRRVSEPIEFDGCTVGEGQRLIYSIYLSQRDPDIWEDAGEFKPERFAANPKAPPFAYIPFGGGPRACMGAAFGQAEARLVIARLLQTHRFELISTRVTAHMGATLEPKPGVMMRARRKTA